MSETLISITHVNLALLLYLIFGALGAITIIARMFSRGDPLNPIGIAKALLFCILIWPVLYVLTLWDHS